MFEKLKEMNAELEQLKKAHLDKSKVMFTEVAALLFAKHPKLESFDWTQYTPYFNDGDECTFSANVDSPGINGIGGYDVDFERKMVTDYDGKKDAKGNYPEKENEMYDPELQLALLDVCEFLSNIDESALRDMFGDHVQISVTRTGTEINSYDHH